MNVSVAVVAVDRQLPIFQGKWLRVSVAVAVADGVTMVMPVINESFKQDGF